MLRQLWSECVAAAILAALALLIWAGICWAKPAPPTPKGHDLVGKTQFGDITQDGRRISLVGENWTASGEIRGDFVKVVWTQLSTGRTGRGLYKIEDAKLAGHWGWQDQCEWVGDDICGEIYSEVIWIERPKAEGTDL